MLLTSANVASYLSEINLCQSSETDKLQIKPVVAKNFNLLVTFPDGHQLLVKQERHNKEGKTANEFQHEWKIQEFSQKFPELENFRSLIPNVLHFDRDNSIIVFRYLNDYRDLADFYIKEDSFPTAIASGLGKAISIIHRATFNHQNHQEFFSSDTTSSSTNQVINVGQGLERITPEIFGLVPADGLKFFALYQRYDSLGQAISELGSAFVPCCLTHNDLKLNNVLLHNQWDEIDDNVVRLIDWERCSWGDPAFDLGTIIASYLQIWLNSLVISSSLGIEESLRLATTPLELLQPSMSALTQTYLDNFPEVLEKRPDFLQRTVQFAGFVLIIQIQAMIQYQKSFGNIGIGMLQVAKSLLCRPERSMTTLFGSDANQLTQLNRSAV